MFELKDKNLYLVGGAVRDEILGIESLDTDYCYEGDAIEFAEKAGLNIIKRNPDFGTVRVKFGEKEIDIASTREETYPEAGHLPEVYNIGCKLKNDLIRRDFTINAIAKNTVTGEIFDYFNGQQNIKNKVLRVLHDKSFIDDPTRIIRGLKFSVRFGFELDDYTKTLQDEYLSKINYDMSYHRIKKELKETFNLNSGKAFDKFVNQKIYKLLGENALKYDVSGNDIEAAVIRNEINNSWIIYAAMFDLSKLPLERREKNIIEWSEMLKTQAPNNNTPEESIIIHSLTV